MRTIRATTTAGRAGAYYVRIEAMARKHCIPLEVEFDEHDTPETKYVVVVDGYLPIATCRLYEETEGVVVIGRVVVLAEYRRRGIGTMVVREAEEWAREIGCRRAVVESRDNKTAFYEQMGYRRVEGCQPIEGETFRCYRMEKEL